MKEKFDLYEVKNIDNLTVTLFSHKYKKRCAEWIKYNPKADRKMLLICGVKIIEYYDNKKLIKI